MKKLEYRNWLEIQKYQSNTIAAQINRAERVEKFYGDLDTQYEADRLASILEALVYSMEDQRRNRPNPTKIPFDGDPRTNLASYRDAVKRYQKFRMDQASVDLALSENQGLTTEKAINDEEVGQRIGLERDMQAALRNGIEQLENGLSIIDDGAERSVESGFIDITAQDSTGTVVVIELKTGVAGQRAVAQILSYMGDIVAEQDGAKVRGILVASDFDSKAKAAARVIPDLALRKYSVRFTFSDGKS
jgi:hypothetical protein